MFRRILGPRDGIAGGSTQLIQEAMLCRCSSLSVVGMTKSKRVRWLEDVSRMMDMRNKHKTLIGKPQKKNYL